jgi:hypothetical protein
MILGRLNHIGVATPSIVGSLFVTLNLIQGPCLNGDTSSDADGLAQNARHGC